MGLPEADVVPATDRRVSRSHAELRCRDGQWELVDLDRRNGTMVAARPVRRRPWRRG